MDITALESKEPFDDQVLNLILRLYSLLYLSCVGCGGHVVKS